MKKQIGNYQVRLFKKVDKEQERYVSHLTKCQKQGPIYLAGTPARICLKEENLFKREKNGKEDNEQDDIKQNQAVGNNNNNFNIQCLCRLQKTYLFFDDRI